MPRAERLEKLRGLEEEVRSQGVAYITSTRESMEAPWVGHPFCL